MAFENLKSTGIKYLLGKLKTVFLQIKDAVKTVNGNEPDENGNITINEVPYAGNLISDSTQTSHDSFILRTAGGTASIESGDAWLMDIKGNSVHEGFVAESLNMIVNAAEREEGDPITATIDRDTFVEYVTQSGTTTLSFTTAWSANPATYGVTVTGTPVNGDSIVITYVKEERGIIYQSNPQAFRSTGWNLYNHSEGYARVVKYSDDFGFRIEGTYTAIQYSATLTGAKSALTVSSGNFTIPGDGFVWVTGGNSSDTAVFMTWSDWTEGANGGTFEAYEETTVDLSSLFTGEGCPFPYGLLNVGTVSDEVNLNLGTAIKRVERMAYNSTNLATARASGREYDYDTDYIYLALATPETISIDIDGSFSVSDHGMEIFDQTDVAVTTQTLYGNNLKNKLERDTLTKSGDLVDNLTTNDGTKVLSAKQGKILNDKIGTVSKSSDTVSNIESWLVTVGQTINQGSFKNIQFVISSASGVFNAKTYMGTLMRYGATVYGVNLQATSPTDFVQGNCINGTWTWNSINDQIANMPKFTKETITSTGRTFTISNNSRIVIDVVSSAQGRCGTLFIYCSGTGSVYCYKNGADDIAVNTSVANKLTLTNANGYTAFLRCYDGAVS